MNPIWKKRRIQQRLKRGSEDSTEIEASMKQLDEHWGFNVKMEHNSHIFGRRKDKQRNSEIRVSTFKDIPKEGTRTRYSGEGTYEHEPTRTRWWESIERLSNSQTRTRRTVIPECYKGLK